MNHDYLWREDMPDSASCDYTTDPVTFFKSLLSPKDRFSYCENNSSYTPEHARINRGYAYQMCSTSAGETFEQVLYVTSQELKERGLRRGDFVIPSNNADRIIRVQLTDNGIQATDTIEASNVFGPTKTVYMDSIYNIRDKKVGYISYLEYDGIDELVPVMKRFYKEQVDELILDLRYNPGGYVSTCKYLSNSLINESGYNEIFQQCTYNDILTEVYKKSTGSGVAYNYFTTPDNGKNVLGTPLYGLNLKRVYVLTSRYSASASEATVISMRPFMDVILIGEQTVGKGVGSWTIRDNRFKYQIQPITMRYHNALMETTPDDGLTVDYYVPDGFQTRKSELGDIKEPLLAKALELISGSMGISVENESAKKVNDTSSESGNIDSIKEVGEPSFVVNFKLSHGIVE